MADPRAVAGQAPRPQPRLSVIVPVYNEEGILSSSVAGLREGLDELGLPYEIILAENGSTDGTRDLLAGIAARIPEVRWQTSPEPNYGRALRQAILSARGEYVICDEIDICDASFHRTALEILTSGRADLVIGSKLLSGAEDRRPVLRHSASLFYNALLRITLGFRGTDTHGLKAFRRKALLEVTQACRSDRDVFASELVIRAERSGIRILEVPVRIAEKRPPSINLVKRVPHVVKNLGRLIVSIRIVRR